MLASSLRALDLGVGGEDLLKERGSGARQAYDEYRIGAGRHPAVPACEKL